MVVVRVSHRDPSWIPAP